MVTGIVIPHETNIQVFAHEFTGLTSYQTAVGGYIEPVQIEHPPMTIFANEEGKMQRLPVNRRATCLWWLLSPSARGQDVLVGDIALVGTLANRSSEIDLPPEFVGLLTRTANFKIEVQTEFEPWNWLSNQARFASYFDAAIYAINLAGRWTQIRDIRVVEAD